MKELLMKYKEIIMYLVFGVLTTVVNIVVYFLSAELLHINYLISNALALVFIGFYLLISQ